jgi:hypothetical protein
MLCQFTKCVKIVHLQCVVTVVIHKIEDDHLETDVHSISSGTDAVVCHEVLQGPSVGIVPIMEQHHMSFSTTVIPRLQFWHLHWSPYSLWATCIHKCHMCYTSCLMEMRLQLPEHSSVWMMTMIT